MRAIAIVQARMTSTRLPGKVLADIGGRPLLELELTRLRAARRLAEIVLAITDRPEDDPLVALADRLDVRWYRGSEHDVLGRYVGAAAQAGAEMVVRVTADCPLIDPEEVDVVVAELAEHPGCDYASNTLAPGLPAGMDCEALWSDVLARVDRMADSSAAREHVTWLIHGEHPELFVCRGVRRPHAASDLRLTVDTREDLELVRRLHAELPFANRTVGVGEIVDHLRAHPELTAINGHVRQKAVTA